MNSPLGEVFMFLTNLAWKSRVTIPVLVTTVFLIMDIRLQIEINIQSGQVDAAELEDDEDSDDEDEDNRNNGSDDTEEEYTTDSSQDENDVGFFCETENATHHIQDDDENDNNANRIRRSLGLS